MLSRDHEKAVTVILTNAAGQSMTCSALMEREVNHLCWNRMSLLGGADQKMEAIRMFDAEVRWTLHRNVDWPADEDDRKHSTEGVGWFRSVGMAQGLSIHDDSVQKFADLEIVHHTDTAVGNWGSLAAEFWFLQRPNYWPSHGLAPKGRATLSHDGPWTKTPGTPLKLRCISYGYLRDDLRASSELELISIPGVEIAPTQPIALETFTAAAEALWFSLKILIIFNWRQPVVPLYERYAGPHGFSSTWRSVALVPRERKPLGDRQAFSGDVLRYLAHGAAALARYVGEKERLHAAVYGYALSFTASSLESALTSCVEAIERLLSVIEAHEGLSREVLDKKPWKAMTKVLRDQLLTLPPKERAIIKRSIASPPSLSLEDRLRRTIDRQGKGWKATDDRLRAGLGDMIKLRNDIVHGRLPGDIARLHIEVVRSQAIFEGLFLNLLGVRGLDRHSLAHTLIFQYEAMLAREPSS